MKNISMLFLLICLVSCSSSSQENQPNVPPTLALSSTIIPMTSTPTPTITLYPSPMPIDTPTPTIEPPIQISKILKNVKLETYDPFDTLDFGTWYSANGDCVQIVDGTLEYTCSRGFFGRNEWAFSEGHGVLLDVKYLPSKENYYIRIDISDKDGKYGTPTHKRFGIELYGESGRFRQNIEVVKGSKWTGQTVDWMKPNTWYSIFMAMKKDGTFLLLIWERDKINASPFKYQRTMKEWAGLKWDFWMVSDFPTTVYWDNFYTLSFSE